jgi:hypothetical protein
LGDAAGLLCGDVKAGVGKAERLRYPLSDEIVKACARNDQGAEVRLTRFSG